MKIMLSELKRIRSLWRFAIPIVLLFSIMIAIIAIYSNATIKNNSIDHFVEQGQMNAGRCEEIIELLIDNVMDTARTVYNDRRIQILAQKKKITAFSEKMILHDAVLNTTYLNHSILSTYLYLKQSDYVVCSWRGLEPYEEFIDHPILDQTEHQTERIRIGDIRSTPFTGERIQNAIPVCIRLPLDAASGEYTNAVFILNIDTAVLEETMKSQSFSVPNGIYLLDDQKHVIFVDTESQARNILSDEYFEEISLHKAGYEMKNDRRTGEPLLVVYTPLSVNDWTLANVYNMRSTLDMTRSISIKIGLLSLCMLLIGMGVCFLIEYRHYKPILRLAGHIENEDGKQVALNVENVVEQTLNYTEDLRKRNKELIQIHTEQFYQDLFHKELTPEEVYEKTQELNIPEIGDQLTLVMVQIQIHEERMLQNEDQLGIEQALKASLVNRGIIYSIWYMPRVIAIILKADTDIADMIQNCRKIQENNDANVQLGIVYCSNVKLGMLSNMCRRCIYVMDLSQKHTGYICDYQTLLQNSPIIYNSDVPELAGKLCAHIRNKDRNEAISALDMLFYNMQQTHSRIYCSYVVLQVTSEIYNLCKNANIDNEKSQEALSELKELVVDPDSSDIVYNVLIHTIDLLIASLEEKTNNRDEIFKKAADYIAGHYQEQIGLSSICAEVGISQTYLNNVLKNRTGFTFVQYLNNYRIDAACRLLKETDMKIGEVGEAVGFMSTHYFIRVFHSIIGTSPGFFRTSNNGRAEE